MTWGNRLNLSHEDWLQFIRDNVRADFETGLLYWKVQRSGIVLSRPIGCKDSHGYIKMSVANKSTYAHIVMYFLYYGIWPDFIIDHEDQVPWNNKPQNLVSSNHSRNALNSKTWETNTSGVKGASITPNGKYKVTKQGKHLGTFNTAKEADDAYNRHS